MSSRSYFLVSFHSTSQFDFGRSFGCDIYMNNLTKLMNGNNVGTQAFFTTVQEFEVEKYSLVQEIFLKYSNRSRNFLEKQYPKTRHIPYDLIWNYPLLPRGFCLPYKANPLKTVAKLASFRLFHSETGEA